MANYQLEQTGAEVQALLNAVESPDTTPAAGSSNLITSGAVQAAVAGVSAKVTALGQKVDGLALGKFYGFFPAAADLPAGDDDGYAYVGASAPFAIYVFDGNSWSDSGTVRQYDPPMPNMEDIDFNGDGELQFANRQIGSGMGYKILRTGASFASQVNAANTIYEVRYDFALGANFTMPDNCELRFNGGSIDGGNNTITMTRTRISGDGKFINCNFAGSILNGEVRISWFTDGMSSATDYTTDHAAVLISAMKLASCKIRHGWLDLERIPLCIKQTVVITNSFGNIGMKNGLFYFVSSSDQQPLFDYQQATAYSGFYSPIVDCVFYDVGDNYNTCVIKKTSWSDTAFTYWKNIKVNGFTGYFFVTNSYVQECTFDNISVDGCGFFSTNSDNLYSGGYGSGNILNFLNCNINGGSSTSKTSIKALYDLSGVIEGTLHNAVAQGRIGGSNIYPIYITYTGVDVRRCNIVLDGFWLENVDGHVKKCIKIEGASAEVTMTRNSIPGLEIVSSNATIRYGQEGGKYSSEFFDNLSIDSDSNVTLIIDSGFYGDLLQRTYYPQFKQLIDDGRLRILQNATPPYGDNLATASGVGITLRPTNFVDIMREYINTKMTAQKYASRPITHKLGVSNGVPVLILENNGDTGTYYDAKIADHFEKLLGGSYATYVSRSIWVECIYRATVLVDVTSENLSEVYCRGRGLLNAGGAGKVNFITPEVGMQAGETTGWVRSAFCVSWNSYGFSSSGADVEIRNCRLELAKYFIGRRNVDLTEEVFIDGNGDLQRTDKEPKIYYLPISSANDTLAYVTPIVNDSPAIVETPKNIYKYVNGAVHAMFNPSAGTTANRPVLSATDAGFVYFDTTLNKAIIWKGAAWVNMDGTAL